VGVKAANLFFQVAKRLMLIVPLGTVSVPTAEAFDSDNLVSQMEAAYAGVADYRMHVKIKTPVEDGSFRTETFLYTFKKPYRIRLDFESPYRGTVLVYPDKEGKVLVRPWGWSSRWEFHLEPDAFLLRNPWGQRIDQTDLGLLIKNISRSIGESRRGPLEIKEEQGHVRLQVLSENHFRPSRLTQYVFLIDKDIWLPVSIEESTPEGLLERQIHFRNLRLNRGIPESLFELGRE
jgi:outer membrane lipoprotein-sorting protein